MEDWLFKNPNCALTDMQYGFRKLKSTCDALYLVKEYIQAATSQNDVVIAISLDICNAFNSIKWRHIRRMLVERRFPVYIRKILNDYLCDRSVEFPTCKGDTQVRRVTAGVPQGSVLGPTLWNLTYDWALRVPLEEDTLVVGYADDTMLLIRTSDIQEGIARANLLTSKILQRIRQLDLCVAEAKTETVIFKNHRRRLPANLNIRVGHEIIPTKQHMKYLGVYLDQNWSFKQHIDYVEDKAMKISQQLGRLMPNLKGPSEKKRRLYANVIGSIIFYGASIWCDAVCRSTSLKRQILRIQRVVALRVISGYRTVSADAALALARIVPIALQAPYLKRVFSRIRDLKQNEEWSRTQENDIKADERIITIRQWQIWLTGNGVYGKRTCEAIGPHLTTWLERRHGELTYRATQLLTRHGCFNAFLHRIGKEGSPICSFCSMEVDTAEHTLRTCERWTVERNTLCEKLGPELRLSVLIERICDDEDNWKALLQFAEKVMCTKKEEERLRKHRRGCNDSDTATAEEEEEENQ